MRFADVDGTTIDEYQAATQMTDESGQTYPANVNSLLDNAVGPQGYYGVFTANMHTDLVVLAGVRRDHQLGARAERPGGQRQADPGLDGRAQRVVVP